MAVNEILLFQILVNGARVLFLLSILILLIVVSKRKELKPDCQKDFQNGFMIYLGLLLFQRTLDYSIQIIIVNVLEPRGYDISNFNLFLFLVSGDRGPPKPPFVRNNPYIICVLILDYFCLIISFGWLNHLIAEQEVIHGSNHPHRKILSFKSCNYNNYIYWDSKKNVK